MHNTVEDAKKRLERIKEQSRQEAGYLSAGRRVRAFHAGWLLTRGLGADYHTLQQQTLEQQRELLVDVIVECAKTTVMPGGWYEQALARWIGLTYDESRFATGVCATAGWLRIGSSAANALETGLALHHTYGVPYLPGSALKGCARAWAVACGVEAPYLDALFGRESRRDSDDPHSGGSPGCVVFHDGWWLCAAEPSTPNGSGAPLVRDVVTSHHMAYYGGADEGHDGGWPSDCDDPNPVLQISAHGAFYLVVEGDPAWAQAGLRLLRGALANIGLGARRAAGYGYFVTDEQAPPCNAAARRVQEWRTQAQYRAARDQLPPVERAKEYLRNLPPNEWARKFSVDRDKVLQQLNIEPAQLREAAEQVIPADVRQAWQQASKKTDKFGSRAHRFLQGEETDDQGGA